MFDLNATAVRLHGQTIVDLRGQLQDTCHMAEVVDKYPGGNRVYLVDPGAAQVFIAEREAGPGPCLDMLVPWSAHVRIPDTSHSAVEIYLNEQLQFTIAVGESADTYIVYSWIGGIIPQVFLSIVPSNHVVPSDYTKEFGPASYAECTKWASEHPGKPV